MVDKKAKTDEPPVVEVPVAELQPYVSEQTRAEQELGRKVAQGNALALAAAQARRTEEENQKKTDDAEREEATRNARPVVFPHAADGKV